MTRVENLDFLTLKAFKMSCSVFGGDSRDTSQLLFLLLTLHIHDLLILKNRRFAQSKTTGRGKMSKTSNVSHTK
jgi:hypothetical protein